ncbi:VCBS domain-containing protein [Microvirga terrae]|uniref:VCBS domain-containing protein n=1 Tax=Microvirga terrae TaxID=2740529 RepID=UPI00156E8CD0|nr:VCBS domain-containing protein [Microvirga terrae]
MAGSLEGIQVKITFSLQGFFVYEAPYEFTSVVVGAGAELVVPLSARILSDTDGDGDMEPVQGDNGLLRGTMTVDISGNQVFAQFDGTAQPAGFTIKIEGLAPTGVAPGTITDQGSMNGVNAVYAPNYNASTKTLTYNWFFMGFQPGTKVDQTVFYDNLLEDAPDAINDAFRTKAGDALAGASVLANDKDLDNGGPLGTVDLQTITHLNGVAADVGRWTDLTGGGRVLLRDDGALQFSDDGDFADLAAGQIRTTSFQYTVTDSTGRFDTATTTITVEGVNDAPTASNLTQTIAALEDSGAVALGDIVVADADMGDTVTATLTLSQPQAGTLSVTPAGSATPTYNALTGVWTVSGSVADVNAALAAVTFTPAPNWDKPVSIATQIRDAAGSGPTNGTITVNVTPTNDAPHLADRNLSLTVAEDAGPPAAGQVMGLLVSDLAVGISDVDSTSGRGIAIVGADASNGRWWFSINGGASWSLLGTPSENAARLLAADGATRLYFEPSADYKGTAPAGLTIRAWDLSAGSNGGVADIGGVGTGGTSPFSTQTDTVGLSVTSVNDAPVATMPGSIAVTEDVRTALAGISFSDKDAGPGNVTVTFSVPVGILGAVSGAGVVVGGTASALTLTGTITGINAFIAAGNVTYIPVHDDTASRTLTVSINDNGNAGSGGSLSDTKSVALTIAAVNDAPVVTVPGSITVMEDAASALTGISFWDVDAGSANVTVTLSIAAGTLAATSGAGVTVGGTTSALTLTGTLADINAFIAASHVTYTSDANGTGSRVLTVSIDDGGHGGSGGSLSDTRTVALTIAAVNDAPVVTGPGSIAVTENTPAALTGITVSDIDAGAGNVTVTLSITGGSLSATTGAGVTVGGTASSLTLVGSIADINAFLAASGVTYTPSLNDAGTRVLTVSINDGGNTGSGGAQTNTRTVDLEIAAVNDAPVATVPASIAVTEDTPTALTGIAFSDIDVGSASVTVTLTVPAGTLSAADGAGVTVGGGASSLTLTGTIADINAFIAGSHVTYTPPANGTGTYALTVSIDDGGNSGSGGPRSDTETVNLDLWPVNDAPVATPPGSIAVIEDTATALAGISFADIDAGSAPVIVTLSVSAGSLSATSQSGVTVGDTASSLTLTGSVADINAFIAASGVIYTPAANDHGTRVLKVSIDDTGNTGSGGALSHTRALDLHVSAVNDVAVIGGTDAGSVAEDGMLIATGVLMVTDEDAGEAGFKAQADVQGTYGTFSFDATQGTWTYVLDNEAETTKTLRSGEAVTETFTVESLDGTVKTVRVQVQGDGALIGGVEVTTETIVYPDGSTGQILTIPIMTAGSGPTDLPLVSAGGHPVLLAQLPTGYGLQVTGPSAPKTAGSSLADLIREIQAHTDGGSADQNLLTGGGSGFLQGLFASTPLIVQSLVPMLAPGSSTLPGQPLVISGAPTAPGTPETALVIDGRGIAGGHIKLENVEFAAIIGALTVTGGTGSQVVFGDSARQTLILGADDDTLHGGGGDDYVGSHGGNDWLYGDDGNDTVSGGIGNDTLDGGTGINIMYGGEGNDTYIVGMASDQVIEYRSEGIDTVRSSVSYILENANVENLVLTGNAAYGYGNGIANQMYASDAGSLLHGSGGNDTLSGGASRDRLYGSGGDDRLYGNGGNDRLYGGTGKDRLEGGTERDYLAGDSGNDILKGDDGHDTINGGSGNDVIYGGKGKDILTGGSGRDVFVFDTKLGDGKIDTIRDFNPWEDTIRLENAVFTKIGPKGDLAWTAFHYGSHAADADDRIIYDWFSGALYYDKDGAGGAAQVQFARIDKHLFLTVSDFVII